MDEKPYITVLEQFSDESGLKFYTNESVKNHFLVHGNAFTKFEYVIFDISSVKKMHLVFSDSLTSGVGASHCYCGLFLEIPVCKNEIRIRKRFFIDRVFHGKRYKTGNEFSDKKIVVFRNNKNKIPITLNTMVVRKFIELNNDIGPLELVTIKNSLSHIPLLHGKHWVAINIDRRWLLDIVKLKTLITKGKDVLMAATNKKKYAV